jgi:hypothetical protein
VRDRPKARLWICAVAVLTGAGCSNPLEVRPELPDREPPAHLRAYFDLFAARTFEYENDRCWVVSTELDERVEFICGMITLGLRPGVRESHIQESLTEVDGSVLSVDDGTDDMLIVRVEVPRYQEGHAILRLLTDPQLTFANLSLIGGGVAM